MTAGTEHTPSARTEIGPVSDPVTALDDQRALTILTTEHWSLLSARSLAYNEAFTRGGMFLTFLSMSFVALALFSSAMAFGDDFLTVAALVLAFDFVIGLATYSRIAGANKDDMRAVHGMARIRHGYTQIAPVTTPYFTTPIHDDPAGIGLAYGDQPTRMPGVLLYGLTTSGGMIELILSMLGGVLAAVLALRIGIGGETAVAVGLGGGLIVFGALVWLTVGSLPREQAELTTLFPTQADPAEGPDRP
ncbi:MAG: hypothetical protein M3Y40_08575 [Chloroflexota bacterium]|nr:hypothetical protein [Chloroflexota bacterium]